MDTTRESRFPRVLSAFLLALIALTFVPGSADAQDLEWRVEWNRFGPWHGVATAAMGAGALSTELFWNEPSDPNWTGPVLLDDGTRSTLLAEEDAGQERASLVSDVLVGALIATPLLMEPAVAYLAHDSPDAATQIGLIGMESMAVTFLTVNVLKRVIARQRPPFGDCYGNPGANATCAERPNVSFPSGHSASAWTGAGLVCVMHEKFELFGSGIGNRIPCYAALAGATTVATMRIVSNNHYLTDTLVGGLIGFGSGYFLPKLLHFGFGSGTARLSDASRATSSLIPIASPQMTGLSYTLNF